MGIRTDNPWSRSTLDKFDLYLFPNNNILLSAQIEYGKSRYKIYHKKTHNCVFHGKLLYIFKSIWNFCLVYLIFPLLFIKG